MRFARGLLCVPLAGRSYLRRSGVRKENMNYQLFIRREGGLLVLRAFLNGEMMEWVKAINAQMMLDYLLENWPVGTRVEWVVMPLEK